MEIQEQPPKAFPFVRSEGSPFEVGRVHGATFGEQIQGSIAYYRAAFESDGLPWEEALTLAGRSGETLRAFDPAIADEMNGIAAGADVDPRTILAINFRTNLRRLKTATKDTDQECTTAALLPEVTATGHMLLAQ